MKKLTLILLSLMLAVSLFACGGNNNQADNGESSVEGESSEPSQDNIDLNGTKVVYVPLDNRPVNFDRAFFLAESAGLELVMPNEEWLTTTLGENYDQGNPKEIFQWLKQQDGDYYVISLDMLFSGGLVGSRAAFDDSDDSIANADAKFGEYTLSKTEAEIIDYISMLSETKHVVLFDTVMRLASTANYGGWDMNLYNYLRGNFASVERKQLYGKELTAENIIAGYMYKADGSEIILGKVGGKDSAPFVDAYLRSRERKLVLAKELYTLCADKVSSLFIGVDDSTPTVNIQSNEIRYLQSVLAADCKQTLLFSGADELGLMGISEVTTAMYGEVKVNLQYFGDGKDYIADGFDPGILSDSINSHIDAVGCTVVTENADMDVLVLTRSKETGTNAGKMQENVNSLIAKLEENLENNVPTCVIDASSYDGYGVLAKAMLDKELDIGEILGFSAWNTVGNATGISLSNATARYAYLKNSTNITDKSHQGFIKTIAFSHVKDTAYKKFGNLPHTSQANYQANYDIFVDYSEQIAERINASSIFVSATELADNYDISLSDLRWPWDRNFEATFTVDVVENGAGTVFAD